jgi:hypothetical protein
MKKWMCLAVLLLSSQSLLPGFDLSASFKLGLGYPFYTGQDYQGWLAFLEDDFLADEGYSVDFDTRFNGKGLGVAAGLSLAIGLSDFFVLQPEVCISRFGGCYGFNDSVSYGEVVYVDRLRCVETMLLAALRLGRGKSRVTLFAGPDVAFRWGEVGIKMFQEGYLVSEGSYVDTQFARLFPNLVAGAGITYLLPKGRLLSLEG